MAQFITTSYKYDLTFLLSILKGAKSLNLVKNSTSPNSIPVKIDPGNPNAIPIDPHYIKKEFTKEKDQFYADIGNANGRLTQNHLDLPPMKFVLLLFSNGIESIDSKYIEGAMTAHESWPFIAASLSRTGTPGPYWYFINKTSDKEQLKSLIFKARKLGNAFFKKDERHKEFELGVISIIDKRPIERTSKYFNKIYSEIGLLETEKDKFEKKVKNAITTSNIAVQDK